MHGFHSWSCSLPLVSCFIKTRLLKRWVSDFHWLRYCAFRLRSIHSDKLSMMTWVDSGHFVNDKRRESFQVPAQCSAQNLHCCVSATSRWQLSPAQNVERLAHAVKHSYAYKTERFEDQSAQQTDLARNHRLAALKVAIPVCIEPDEKGYLVRSQ